MALIPRETLTDHVGAWRTQSLYRELNQSKLEPVFTLKDEDYDYNGTILPSLKRIYLEIADPTEYSFAIEVFGSWNGWVRQCDNVLLSRHIAKWRDELEVKLRSNAIKSLYEAAMETGAKGVNAAKYIAERGWEKRAGRPSKIEVERQKRIEAGIKADLDDDLERLGVH